MKSLFCLAMAVGVFFLGLGAEAAPRRDKGKKANRPAVEEPRAARHYPGWSAGQATGPPDVSEPYDNPGAWTPVGSSSGTEWLQLKYRHPVNIAEVRIRESASPGAVSKVTAVGKKDKEVVLWEGNDPTTKSPDDFVVRPRKGTTSGTIKVYLDTTRKAGWNEIDAVELVGKDGSRQWAQSATASSSWGSGISSSGPVLFTQMGDPLAEALHRQVKIRVGDDRVIEGELADVGSEFVLLVDADRVRKSLVNRRAITLIEWQSQAPEKPAGAEKAKKAKKKGDKKGKKEPARRPAGRGRQGSRRA